MIFKGEGADGMSAIEILREYKAKKEHLAMIQSQLDYLDKPKIKTRVITDEIAGGRISLHEKYEKLMAQKERLKLKWLTLRLETSATEKALELMSVYMPYQLNALKMKYLELKQIGYIADELGFGERTIKRYIKEAEQELERLFEDLA